MWPGRYASPNSQLFDQIASLLRCGEGLGYFPMSTRIGTILLPAILAAAVVLPAVSPAPTWAQSSRRFLEPPSSLPRIQNGIVK